MNRDTRGWRAAVDRNFGPMIHKVYLWQNIGSTGRAEYVKWNDQGRVETVVVEADVMPPDECGLILPSTGMAEAMAEAFAERFGPSAEVKEIRRLEEALAIERARVEKLIDATVGRIDS